MRMHAQTAMIENGFVRIPENASWLAEYLHEMNVFPKGKHDDQVDSTAQFLDWLKKPMPNWGIFECTRQRAQEIAQQPKDRERHRVLLEGPVGQSVQTFSGRHLEVAWDGTLEVSAYDAEPLMRHGWRKLGEWIDDGQQIDQNKPEDAKIIYAVGSLEWQAQQEEERLARIAAEEYKEKRRLARVAAVLENNRKHSSSSV